MSSTIKDNGQKGRRGAEDCSTSGKSCPSEYTKKMPSISQSDLDKGISDVRKYGGAIPFGDIGKTLVWLLMVFALSALSTFAMQFIMSDVAQKTVNTLRQRGGRKAFASFRSATLIRIPTATS